MCRRILAVAAAPTAVAAPAASAKDCASWPRSWSPSAPSARATSAPQDGTLESGLTRLFSQEQWLPTRFAEEQVRSDPAYSRAVVRGRR